MSSTLHAEQPGTSSRGTPDRWESQRSFDELGRPLRDITFTVVDLETTGGSAEGGSMITEIGAVKVRGGEVLGEFQTLVDPRQPIPPFIAVLTGISNAMVADAPPVESALPAFLEFAAGTVLVAHNAPFDIGFLKYFCEQQGRPWPTFEVLDTARLARRVITKDDAPNCKLSSLARAFGSTTTPNHRALSDARATVDVLHGLMERLGGLGVHTLEELQTFSGRVSTAQRRKRHLAEGLPHAPGVYLFRDHERRVLYVGTSKDLRTRVRTYFTASETRSRMGEMVGIADSVTGIECATPLEAEVRELRLIAEHKPRYNRRSRFPEKTTFIKLTREPWPRLSLVKRVLDDDADYLGPFSSRKVAEKCLAALHDTFPLRQCSDRFGKTPSRTPCVLAELGRCLAPCDGTVDHDTYAAVVRQLRDSLLHRPDRVVEQINARMEALAADERFEEAGVHRDRLAAFIRAASRTQRLSALTRCPEVVAARRGDDGRWAVHVVRHGRLAAAGVIPPGTDAHTYVASLRASAETVAGGPGPVPVATAEETEKILRWLESPGIRLVDVEGEWVCPVDGATRHLALHDAVARSRTELVPFDDRRDLTPVHQPAR
ncbi:DEDD exonuclease domain-containing protein [Nocardioides sp. zg-579]|uniref:DEDD exonuclease domain-containing protein n=1 Tax=Nocardioides marmotae TaxID=2663857 RepID=A0A6I3JBN7_9ACTN|nr:DEDD exonuclease domain-containing protein [Nocardioides marmotae]MCR6031897.1 DEDD exonuclease domain-containing protein [Gordonia jinghuaiqii]MTB95537.1 DEDD exonuclease domain-containing protein [Nocardioides marmotae]QKE00961.1 DEDD exonuclease domain-containing protein [Nocardioides marmotae]